MIKKLGLLLILFFSYNNVSALELCTPSKEYLDYIELPVEERLKYQEPIYCSSVFNKNLSTSTIATGNVNNVVLGEHKTVSSSFYNAYDDGIVKHSENQYRTGLCWDFSALSVVETNAMKNKADDHNFSEAHLAYSILAGLYSDQNGQKNKYNYGMTGGKITFAPTYFYNNYGQLLENELMFKANLVSGYTTLMTIDSNNYRPGNNYITVEKFEIDNINDYGVCSNDEINNIKSYVLNYGSVQASMYMDEGLFDQSYNYYMSTTSNASGENHGVVIVGWDDKVSKSMFNGATRDGAWIVKNSWGNTWSNDGLFYISYDDNFVCKSIGVYSGVSNKQFEYTYKAADLVGNLTLGFTHSIYTTAKFTKQLTSKETIDRISFPTAKDSVYSVYLSKDNDISNRNNWTLLKNGISNTYGIDSINLEGIEVDNDFTIIVGYEFDPNSISSIFMMCTNTSSDYSSLDISTNTNYISTDGINWEDMGNIDLGSLIIGCEPNIYAYTNSMNDVPKLQINAITNIDDNINLTITKKNISNSSIAYKVLDSNNKDVTSHFTITPNYNNSNVNIVSDNTVSGDFTITMNDNSINTSTTFKLDEEVKSISNNLNISGNNIVITIGRGKTLTYKDVLDNLKVTNTSINVNDSKGKIVTSDTSSIGTDSTIKTNNKNYKVIVLGDSNGDGTIDSADLLRIVKYLKNPTLLNSEQKKAADVTSDSIIDSADLLRIVKFLRGKAVIEYKE